ncbi:MAG: glycosyltransferase family 4 protein [bacterium]
MRVLVICHEHPPLGGGGGWAASQIAMNLVKLENKVEFITSHFSGLERKEVINGYLIHRVNIGRRSKDGCSGFELLKFMFLAIPKTLRIIKDFHPDFIIAFFTLPSGFITLLSKFCFRIPYIVSLRGGDVPGFLPNELGFYHKITKPLIKLIWKNSSSVIANSIGLQELAKKTLPNVKVIYNGADLEFFKPDLTQRKNGKVKILFVGRLVYQKNPIWFIQAIPEIAQRTNTSFEIEIVGDGPLRSSVEREVNNLNLKGIVKISGWLRKDELLKKYQASDIFVLPSIEEGMPNVVIEAMACGLPIVATNIPGTNELVKDGYNGILVELNDKDKWMDTLVGLIENRKKREEMGLKSLELIQKFTWHEVTKMYLEEMHNG